MAAAARREPVQLLDVGTLKYTKHWEQRSEARGKAVKAAFKAFPDWNRSEDCDEDVEARFEQSISVGVSQTRISPLSQKTHPYEMCGLVLKDILHLAERKGTQHSQKLLSATFEHQQEQHMEEKAFRSSVDTGSFVTSCRFCVSEKPFPWVKVWKDFLASFGHLQQQATHTRKKPQQITHCKAALQSRKRHYTWEKITGPGARFQLMATLITIAAHGKTKKVGR
ncbi:hypothetical protein HPG69_007233 [Diceros bicornis minor]|uniref:Uncharacterized protein n=1 Tax=Diceros bicornis minor TaxID=77932 RepID=A0A7J7FN39_DICBM|nr:hypothetical protein HPG69_007233 [Diceros bicornis minor]